MIVVFYAALRKIGSEKSCSSRLSSIIPTFDDTIAPHPLRHRPTLQPGVQSADVRAAESLSPEHPHRPSPRRSRHLGRQPDPGWNRQDPDGRLDRPVPSCGRAPPRQSSAAATAERPKAPSISYPTAARCWLTADQAGDEPAMLARQLPGIAVLTGKIRLHPCRHAIERLGSRS